MGVIVLTGLPGSGKSTVCKEWFPNHTRINQDILGSRDACIKAMSEALDRGESVIVDRVNINAKQRKFWVDIALGHGVKELTSLVLVVSDDECVARVDARKNHETIKEDLPIEKKRQIVYNFLRDSELPTLAEGFSSIIIHKNY